MKKVLISDNLSEEGIEIFKKTPGIEVDVKTKLTPDELKAIIKDYDGLVIRSATKVTQEIIDRGRKAQRRRPGRHRPRQRGRPGGQQTGHRRHEHPRRQHHHHGRARHRHDAFPGPADPPGHGLHEGRQVGKEQVHGA